MTTPVDNLSAVQDLKNDLILKTTNYSIFRGGSSATALTRATVFSATTGQLNSTAFTNYDEMGYITDDGVKFARSISREDITALQSTSPVRSDVTSDETTMQFEAEETNLATLATYIGVTIASTTPDAGGSISVDQPQVASSAGAMWAGVGYDAARDIYIVKYFPNGVIDSLGDQAYQKSGALGYSVTVKALFDATEGTAVRWLFGGAGWLTRLTALGLTAGA